MSRRASTVIRAVVAATATAVVATVVAGFVTGSFAGSPSADAATAGSTKPVMSAAQILQASPAKLYSGGLSVSSASQAGAVVSQLKKAGKKAEAASIQTIADQPVALWLGDWYSDRQLVAAIRSSLDDAAKQNRTPTFVLYAIPDRDCGDYSKGGFTATQYRHFVELTAKTLTGHRAVVLDEPDSLAMLSNCPAQASTRIPLIKYSVQTLSAAGVTTYLDGGNSHWVDPALMAQRLEAAGVSMARGFFSNVSNFYPLADETAYDDKVSALTGGAHYVVDTSRNGQGWKGTWCNPTGAGLGAAPTVASGTTKLDATLWVKTPGASDGTCNGGPSAGTWWESYALKLVKLRAK